MNILFEIVRAETKSPLRLQLREFARKRFIRKLWRVTPKQLAKVEAATKQDGERFNEQHFERVLAARNTQSGERAK